MKLLVFRFGDARELRLAEVAQWLRRRTIESEVAGSVPGCGGCFCVKILAQGKYTKVA